MTARSLSREAQALPLIGPQLSNPAEADIVGVSLFVSS